MHMILPAAFSVYQVLDLFIRLILSDSLDKEEPYIQNIVQRKFQA